MHAPPITADKTLRWLTWLFAAVTAFLFLVIAFSASSGLAEAEVCEPRDQKIDTTGDPQSITVTAPEGKLITGYCIKAGTEVIYITLDAPVSELTITSPNGKAISHYIIFYEDAPEETTTTTSTTLPEETTTTIPEQTTTTVPEETTTVPEQTTTTVPEDTTTVPQETITVPEEPTTTAPGQATTTLPSTTQPAVTTGPNVPPGPGPGALPETGPPHASTMAAVASGLVALGLGLVRLVRRRVV